MNTTNYKNINAYIRSATGEEEDIARQIKDIENYCNEHFPGLPISWFIDRNYSGLSPVNDRPAYMEMCRAIQPDEPSICIVKNLSKISINNIELARAIDGLIKNNVSICTTLGILTPLFLDFIRYIACMPNQRDILEDLRNSIRKEI